MSGPVYIFAGGGTGGHLYPGLAVAGEVARLRPDARVVFVCSNRLIDRRVLDPTPWAFVPQPVRPLPRRPWQVPGFLRAWWASRRLGRDLLRDLNPVAVLGLGGFAAGPLVREAAARSIPTGLLNPDAVVGKANRYLARFADVVFAQFESIADELPEGLGGKVRAVGCPVRPGLTEGRRSEAVEHFGLWTDRRTLLVLGGSLGAASINAAVVRLGGDLDALGDRWQLLHVTGPSKDGPPAGGGRMHVVRREYVERMDLAYAAADLALCRGGASTIAELAATGTPAVVLPYPHHADRQQWRNAEALEKRGAAVIVPDAADPGANAETLRTELVAILRDEARLETMQAAADTGGHADAASRVAEWLIGALPGG